MGIQVPNTHNGELAMASEWKATARQPTEDAPVEDSLSKGIRKRRPEEEDEDEGESKEHHAVRSNHKVWGKSTKTYPGQDNPDLDSLLSAPLSLKKAKSESEADPVPVSPFLPVATSATAEKLNASPKQQADIGESPDINQQVGTVSVALSEGANLPVHRLHGEGDALVKAESGDSHGETVINSPTTNPVFKKRKSKPTSTAIQHNSPGRIL
jgi:hypothetical protein